MIKEEPWKLVEDFWPSIW